MYGFPYMVYLSSCNQEQHMIRVLGHESILSLTQSPLYIYMIVLYNQLQIIIIIVNRNTSNGLSFIHIYMYIYIYIYIYIFIYIWTPNLRIRFDLSGPDICCPMFLNTGPGGVDIFIVYLYIQCLFICFTINVDSVVFQMASNVFVSMTWFQ